jgi:hypothetical protein
MKTILLSLLALSAAAFAADDGFTPLFNGKDFANWVVPEGDNGHWKVIDGVIDYDACSEAPGRTRTCGPRRNTAISR